MAFVIVYVNVAACAGGVMSHDCGASQHLKHYRNLVSGVSSHTVSQHGWQFGCQSLGLQHTWHLMLGLLTGCPWLRSSLLS